jgi:hypothetical protein
MVVFRVVAPCSLVEIYQSFRGPCCLHHQGDRPDGGGSSKFSSRQGTAFATSRPALGSTATGNSFLRERESDLTPPFSIEVKSGWIFTSNSLIHLQGLVLKHRDNIYVHFMFLIRTVTRAGHVAPGWRLASVFTRSVQTPFELGSNPDGQMNGQAMRNTAQELGLQLNFVVN